METQIQQARMAIVRKRWMAESMRRWVKRKLAAWSSFWIVCKVVVIESSAGCGGETSSKTWLTVTNSCASRLLMSSIDFIDRMMQGNGTKNTTTRLEYPTPCSHDGLIALLGSIVGIIP